MKSSIIFLITITAVLTQEYYDDKYDVPDMESFLSNEVVLKAYLDCVLDREPCGEKLEGVKERAADALKTACVKCSPHQLKSLKVLMQFLGDKRPEDLAAILKKYDPENKYIASFYAAINKAE